MVTKLPTLGITSSPSWRNSSVNHGTTYRYGHGSILEGEVVERCDGGRCDGKVILKHAANAFITSQSPWE